MADKHSTPDLADAMREALRPMVRDVVSELLAEFWAGEPLKPELLTSEQICQALQVSRATLHRRLIPAGLPTLRLGDSPRFRLADVLAWVEKQSRCAESGP